MYVLVCAAAGQKAVRAALRTIAADHGLIEVLPMVFQGRLSSYRTDLFQQDLRRALHRRRSFHMELMTIPDEHFHRRTVIAR